MNNRIENKIKAISSLIGNTPLLEIKLKYKGEDRILYDWKYQGPDGLSYYLYKDMTVAF